MKLTIDITEEMANKLDEIAKKKLVSREHIAMEAVSSVAIKVDREHRFLGFTMAEIAQGIIAVGESLREMSDRREDTTYRRFGQEE